LLTKTFNTKKKKNQTQITSLKLHSCWLRYSKFWEKAGTKSTHLNPTAWLGIYVQMASSELHSLCCSFKEKKLKPHNFHDLLTFKFILSHYCNLVAL